MRNSWRTVDQLFIICVLESRNEPKSADNRVGVKPGLDLSLGCTVMTYHNFVKLIYAYDKMSFALNFDIKAESLTSIHVDAYDPINLLLSQN